MNFRTIVDIPAAKAPITYNNKIMLLGSCFVERIGAMLYNNKFNASLNPFGVIYNPFSVANSLQILMDNKKFTHNDLNYSNDLYFTYAHHSSFSNTDADACLHQINTETQAASLDLSSADYLFITFGTAWVYELIDSGEVVSNCHKQPANNFNRYRLEVDEIVSRYKELIVDLALFNPNLKIVFTVSPVRHWKDTAHGNQLSKAVLLLAVNQLVELFEQVTYFPSYELVMDELRDYRFYSEDMLHIGDAAVNYIWERFMEVYFDKQTAAIQKQVQQLIRASEHRPFNPETAAHQKFVAQTLHKMDALEQMQPNISFDKERKKMKGYKG